MTPWTVAHQAPLSMGILQARILEWVVMPSSRGSSQPRSPELQVDFLPAELPAAAAAKSLQSCQTLCDPIDSSPPGSSVYGDSPGNNTRVGGHALPGGSSPPKDRTQASPVQVDSLPAKLPGKGYPLHYSGLENSMDCIIRGWKRAGHD